MKIIIIVIVTNPPGIGSRSPFSVPAGNESIDPSIFLQSFFQSSPSLAPNSFPFHPALPLAMDRSSADALSINYLQKQLLAEQHQKRLGGETISNLTAIPSYVANYTSKNLSNIGGQEPEVNTNEMVVRVKSILSENNIAQKVMIKYDIIK